jgi:hypothetical protein
VTTVEERIWYVAYGSNLSADRFRCYLTGGRPEGARVRYAGCRETTEPSRTVPLEIPGALYFTGPSRTWGGGTAVYDRDGSARVAVTAYLVRVGQLSDVVAQETHRPPGTDLDMEPLRRHGYCRSGPGRYETLLQVGIRDGIPMVTLTSERSSRTKLTPPTGRYLHTMAQGLRDAHRWNSRRIATYLVALLDR